MQRGRAVAVGLAVTVLLAAGVVTAVYPRQTRALLTHWKGSPTHTVAYVAPSPSPDVRVAVAGDVGYSGDRVRATGDTMAQVAGRRGFDVLLLLGDNVYPDGDPGRLADTVFGAFDAVLARGTRLLAILGNHDVIGDHGDDQIAALGMPGRWWSTRMGDVLFVGLDSNEVDNATQHRWLDRTLAASDARWKIVAVHHPPYSAGYQGSAKAVRDAFSPLFERYGVQLVLSGHDHDYQRSTPQRGVTYVVTGGAAGTRRTGSRDFTAASFSWHHFVELDVYEDRLVLRAVNQDARVADTWTLRPG